MACQTNMAAKQCERVPSLPKYLDSLTSETRLSRFVNTDNTSDAGDIKRIYHSKILHNYVYWPTICVAARFITLTCKTIIRISLIIQLIVFGAHSALLTVFKGIVCAWVLALVCEKKKNDREKEIDNVQSWSGSLGIEKSNYIFSAH
jgi:hypothetical protein